MSEKDTLTITRAELEGMRLKGSAKDLNVLSAWYQEGNNKAIDTLLEKMK